MTLENEDHEALMDRIESTRRARDASARVCAQYLLDDEPLMAIRHAENYLELAKQLQELIEQL